MNNQSISAEQQIQCQNLINAWQQDYAALYDLLLSEKLALQERNFETLAAITEQKNELLNQITQRQAVNGSTAIAHQQLKSFVQQIPELEQSWQSMLERASHCQMMNEINGQMLAMMSNANRRTLNIVRGIQPDNNIYDKTGSRHWLSKGKNSVAV